MQYLAKLHNPHLVASTYNGLNQCAGLAHVPATQGAKWRQRGHKHGRRDRRDLGGGQPCDGAPQSDYGALSDGLEVCCQSSRDLC